jgi:hypothetical protein
MGEKGGAGTDLVRKPEKRDNLEDISLGGKIILK